MKELISIVVPIYNVEDYLKECIDSICGQSYKNIEIILVDDGSTDGSPAICDVYAGLDNRIRVIHKKNGGLSDARNCGLEVARGEYVAFVDSDDYVNERFIEFLYNAMEDCNAQIAVCSYQKVYDTPIAKSELPKYVIEEKNSISFLESLYQGKYSDMGFVAWNKLYKRQLFVENNILYPKGRIYEDTFTTYKLLYFAEGIAIVDYPLYCYRMRSGSIMQSKIMMDRCRDWIDSDLSAVDFFREKREQRLFDLALNAFLRSQIIQYKMLTKNDKEWARYILNSYRECYRKNIGKSRIRKHKKLIYRIFMLTPDLIALIY